MNQLYDSLVTITTLWCLILYYCFLRARESKWKREGRAFLGWSAWWREFFVAAISLVTTIATMVGFSALLKLLLGV